MKTKIATILLGLALCCVGRAEQIIRTAADLRSLSPEVAERALPVEMEVVATFVDRSRGMLFVHDGKNGFFVGALDFLKESAWLVAGRKMRLRGITSKGEFLPLVVAKALEDLGAGVLPDPPASNSMEDILAPKNCSQWVEVEGVVKRVAEENGGITLCLQVGEYRLPLELPRNRHYETPPELPLHLLEHRVRMRVVAATQFNSQRQMSGRMLYLPGFEFLAEMDAEPSSAPLPLRRVDELLLASSPLHERVRVRGVVTYAVPGQVLFLRGEGGSMKIESALTPDFKPGTRIEAEGVVTFFPFRPGLNATRLTMLDQGPSPKPLHLDYSSERRSDEQFELVTLDTTLVDTKQTTLDVRLLCRSGDVRFEAKLPYNIYHAIDLESGMRLRLTGICELELDNPFGIARFTKVFSVRLRSKPDLAILQRPPYWNNQRLLLLLSVTFGAGLLFATWVRMLRRQVAAQSSIIERQTATRATLDERQRIARDLHDTLEQELSGVSILLDTAAQQVETGDSQSGRTLRLARQLLRHSRKESRTTIRDLRSVAIEQLGLVGAMRETLRPLVESASMVFDFTMSGEVVPLPGTVESIFLRIAHEAVANAAKHSRGSRVNVRMAYGPDEIRLDVSDDGLGFSPETAAIDYSEHFGISGMRERAARMGAVLQLDGRCGEGTRISLIWSLARAGKPADLVQSSFSSTCL